MKKIPTLFQREFEGHKIKRILPDVTPGLEWVLEGKGDATIKWDGACCAVIDGTFYKRYDAKKGKQPPTNAIPCFDPDPVTGHWPHWIPVMLDEPADKWFVEAAKNYNDTLHDEQLLDRNATYEAIGPHFQGNPYGLEKDTLVEHGTHIIPIKDRSFGFIKCFLEMTAIEGIVFWKDRQPQCKIKRTDFGFTWPVEGRRNSE